MLFIYQREEYGDQNFQIVHKQKYDFPLECMKISADGKILVGFSESSTYDDKDECLEMVTVYNILLKKEITKQVLNLNDRKELREDPSKLFLIAKNLTS